MQETVKNIEPLDIEFDHTAFDQLMQNRIRKVLLICSNYDTFMLEEDARVDEQIFNEYVSLNLRYPPVFIQANSANRAFEILKTQEIDLVIEMLNIGGIDTFKLAKVIKSRYPDIPIVVLTHFSREVSLRLQNEDMSAIDYVFCWLGNSNLLLAIVKLIEDRMNAKHDVEVVGVQTILFVEDSIRYVSSYLPNLYTIVMKQSREFMKEALNEHQRMLRRRGRPKILVATNFEDAMNLFQQFKQNMLGIISDISFKKNARSSEKYEAGIEFLRVVREEDEFIPFLLQSSDERNRKYAEEMNAGFIHKYSKNLSNELRDYIVRHFNFGDFVFLDPVTKKEVARAPDLQTLQHAILKIPDTVLEYHTSKNDFSKWLNARAIFPVAQMFKHVRISDFSNLDGLRYYIYKAILSFRISKGRGVIARFEKDTYDEYLMFSRIGEGSIGGKARGLAFINSIIKKRRLFGHFPDVVISIPRTVVLSTDVFDEFMDSNNLYREGLSDKPDEEILGTFVRARLPAWLIPDLHAFLKVVKNPLAVRSSSKLEDSHYQPFAGIYSTYMVPRVDNREQMTEMLCNAIKCVYASVYFQSSKAYMEATSNVIDEEKMGIILQEVCGKQYGGKFYPTVSGVAHSVNFYPIPPEKATDGVANIAYGLGKYVMDGGQSLRFSPKYPKKIMQLSSPEMAVKESQKIFYSLDLRPDHFLPSPDDGINLLRNRIEKASGDKAIRYAVSVYDHESNMIRDGADLPGRKIVTFSSVLNHNVFPLAEILQTLLAVCEEEMNVPIEIEFAANLDVPQGEPRIFNFLQIRPIVLSEQSLTVKLDKVPEERTIIRSETALGNGSYRGIHDFVYVNPRTFDPKKTGEIASSIEKLNNRLKSENRSYILMGPGRWGSSDPWLGIPVKWVQISNARVIIESGLEKFRVDPSQGTHFFQNITSFRIGYFTINPFLGDGHFDLDYLESLPAVYQSDHVRHLRFDKSVPVQIDGRSGKGIIYKPV